MTAVAQCRTETFRESETAVLTTARLVLRAPTRADAQAIAALINDRGIAQNTATVPHPYTLADAETFIAQAGRGGELAFVVTLSDGTIVGGCGAKGIDRPAPEIGYWYGVPYWGQGYATEAALALVDHAFADLGRATLLAGARVSNPASRRVLEKCGFQWTGVALRRVRALNWSVPCDRFRLERERWAALQSSEQARRVA